MVTSNVRALTLPAVHLALVGVGDVVFATHWHQDPGTDTRVLPAATLPVMRFGDVSARA